MNDSFLNELNNSQREAVLYNRGASLIIAGAGSGKTRVLTYKIAYLLSSGYEPDAILALTFTNKAAKEMKNRIADLVGIAVSRKLWMGTFHSIFLRILRANSQLLNYNSQFTIYDSSDSRSLIHAIIKEKGLNDKEYSAGKIQSKISSLKNQLILPNDYERNGVWRHEDIMNGIGLFYTIYQTYQKRCKIANVMDFDDLLMNVYLLFDKHPEVCSMYANHFKYILVDEYQDTNYVQHKIVLQLGMSSQNVCVVGDDAQSIYSFRGANIDNILSFEKFFNHTKVFKLEQNYRSTQNIVLAANSLIKKNRRQIPKNIYSENDKGDSILVTKAYSDIEEAAIVIRKIIELRSKERYIYSDFAILYRTNAQSRVFEEELRKNMIAYRIYGGLSFYQRKEIKDVIAYFRLIVNTDDEEALMRIVNFPPRGLGNTTINKIKQAAIDSEVSLLTVISSPVQYGVNLNKSKLLIVQNFYNLIYDLSKDISEIDAYSLGVKLVQQSGLLSVALNDNIEDKERKDNIAELLNGMKDFVSSHKEEGNEHVFLSDYLSEIALITDQDIDGDDENKDKVTLMTIHSSKGLEFQTVFIVGLEEGLFPSYLCADSEKEMEEERRLLYVAITRAEKHCFLSYAESRYHFGKVEISRPSRFLNDIDKKFLHFPLVNKISKDIERKASHFRPIFESYHTESRIDDSGSFKSINNVSHDLNVDDNKEEDLFVGQMIRHERFGVGEVEKIEGTGENSKATIRFKNVGIKVLLLRFARFEVIK